MKELFNFTAGVDVVHIGIENDLEHHPGMVRAAAAFLIQLPETFKVQALNQSVNHPNWIMLCNILVNSLRKKHCLVGIIRTKMYLCHSENLMPKDTKSLGNNKAPACESRGFVLKKKKVRILTHLPLFSIYVVRDLWQPARVTKTITLIKFISDSEISLVRVGERIVLKNISFCVEARYCCVRIAFSQ